MYKFLSLYFILILSVTFCYADCTFIVTNNSTQPLNVEAGFFNKNKINFLVPAAGVVQEEIKSDLKCTEVTPSGLGLTYVNLVGDKSQGGWVYAPESKMIHANGDKASSSDGRIGSAPNGLLIFLSNNYKPKNDVFSVEIKNVKRNVSRQLGSMD